MSAELEKKAGERARKLCRTHVLFPDWRKDDTGIPLVCPNCDDITAALLDFRKEGLEEERYCACEGTERVVYFPPICTTCKRMVNPIQVPPKPWKDVKGCNRHSNCKEADNKFREKYGKEPGFTFHCHDETCEDCFGN